MFFFLCWKRSILLGASHPWAPAASADLLPTLQRQWAKEQHQIAIPWAWTCMENMGRQRRMDLDDHLPIFCPTCMATTISHTHYQLVNIHTSMENHRAMGKLTISMAIFNSYFDITRGYHCDHLTDDHCDHGGRPGHEKT